VNYELKRGATMICSNCKKNDANTHIKENINGQLREYYLCPNCAKSLNYSNFGKVFDLDLNSFFGSALSKPQVLKKPETEVCETCGAGFDYLIASGKVGCADCYKKFAGKLYPSIQRIHGNTKHSGKIPSIAGKQLKVQRQINELKQQLEEAIKEQEFEKAAEFRDQLKALAKEDGGNE